MNNYMQQVSAAGRQAVMRKDWTSLAACAGELLKQDQQSPEGFFLQGQLEKASNRHDEAVTAFSRVIELDAGRYDAAIELANQYSILRQNGDAAAVLTQYESFLDNSPMYLNMAGTVYSQIGMSENAWPLFKKADALQPGIDRIQSNLATCCVVLGKIEKAKSIYERLLEKHATHQQYHYKLAVLEKARDGQHIDQMKKVLETNGLPPDEKRVSLLRDRQGA